MVTQLFSFGYGHLYPNGFVRITAGSKARCREIMFETCGDKWAFQYDAEDEEKLVAHGMYEVSHLTVYEDEQNAQAKEA